jgi:ketosteroid isomerase-like protein
MPAYGDAMRVLTATTTILICSALAGPAAAEPAETLLRAQDRLARSVERAGPVAGFVPYLATDVAYLHPGQEIITGRLATRTFLRSIYPHGAVVKLVLHTIAGDESVDRRLGYTFGWFEETSGAGSSTPSFGKFIATWKKGAEGWRVQGFLRLQSPQPPSAAPPDALILDGEPGIPVPDLPAAHRLDIAVADSRFSDLSIAEGYSTAFPAYAADAAVLAAPGDFFWNRAGIESAFAGWTPDQTLSWYPLRAEAAASGDLGWSIGHGTFAIDGGETVQRFYSKYLTIWIRTADGWRWLLDAGNPRPTP